MCSGVKSRALICLGLYVLALPGCDEAPPPPDRPAQIPEQPSAPALPSTATTSVDEGPASASDSGDARTGGLVNFAEESARFTTFDACVASLPRVGALAADALEDLGLGAVHRDACRLVEAVHGKSAVPCRSVDVEFLERRCFMAAAVVRGESELCPAIDSNDPTRGRDALCLALATHRLQPCDSLEASDATTCRASTRQDRALCTNAPTRARRQACLRSVERWRGLVGPVSEPTTEAVRATLERSEGTRDFDDLARAGAVVVERGGKRRFVVDASRGRARLRLRARIDGNGAAELETFELTEAGLVLARSGPLARVAVVVHEGDAGTPTGITATVRPGHGAEGFTSFVITTPVRDRLASTP